MDARFYHFPATSIDAYKAKHADDWEGCPGSALYVDDLRDRRRVRCPSCRRRLLPAEVHCVGGELVGYRLPRHKPKGRARRLRFQRRGKLYPRFEVIGRQQPR